MEGNYYIGTWLRTSDENGLKPHNWFRAIAVSNNGSWIRDNLSDLLPPKSEAFFPNAGIRIEREIACVKVKKNHREDLQESHDLYLVDEVIFLRPVYDYRIKGQEQARHDFVDIGISRENIAFSNEVIVALDDECCVLVKLKENDITGRFHPDSISRYRYDAAIFDSEPLHGEYYEIPDHTLGTLLDNHIEWKKDQEILESALRNLKRHGQDGPSRKEIEGIISVFNRMETFSNDRTNWFEYQEWLELFIPRMRKFIRAPKEIADTLLYLPEVKNKLAELEKQLMSELKPKIEAEIRSNYDGQIYASKIELNDINEAILAQKIILDDLLTEQDLAEESTIRFREALSSEVRDLNKTLSSDHMEHPDFTTKLIDSINHILDGTGHKLCPVDNTIPPWGRLVQGNSIPTISLSELRRNLRNSARNVGLEGKELEFVDVLIRSGEIVVLKQDIAEFAVPAYAKVVTGGCFIREPIGPHILSLDDLWLKPSYKMKTGFARAWEQAESCPDTLVIVWLDGIQRSSMSLWLPSLTGILRSDNRPMNLLIIASFDENIFDKESIPKNIVSLCTPICMGVSEIETSNLSNISFSTLQHSPTPEIAYLSRDEKMIKTVADLVSDGTEFIRFKDALDSASQSGEKMLKTITGME